LGNDGAVSVKATDANNRRTPFSHTRVYPITAGYHIYFAVAENIGGYIGSGIASIYASLSVEYFPDIGGQAFVKHQGIAEYNINVRGNPVVVGQVNITAPLPGQVWVQFDGHCYSDVGDRITLAASSSPDFRGGGNDGIVLVEATNSDLRNDSFSHSRVYLVPAGSHDLYALAENYVETAGNGEASIYASLTVEFFPGSVSEVKPSGEVPTEHALSQNYPNPFNPSTTIEFALPHAGYGTLKVYNVLGEEVASLIAGDHAAGTFKATWDASDMPSGVYFYRLTTGEYVQTRKMILMK
jgi:hypothetical protein